MIKDSYSAETAGARSIIVVQQWGDELKRLNSIK